MVQPKKKRGTKEISESEPVGVSLLDLLVTWDIIQLQKITDLRIHVWEKKRKRKGQLT
jgi:hypothetical protein